MESVSKARHRKQAALIRKLKRELRDAQYKRYVIRMQWRSGKCNGDPRNWRSWRTFASVPILFYSEEEAWGYFYEHDVLKNAGRKASASVEVVWLPEKINES